MPSSDSRESHHHESVPSFLDEPAARGTDATLRRIPPFGWCCERTVARLATERAALPFAAGEMLADERRPGGELIVISKGVAAASIDGRPIVTLGPGDFFGASWLIGLPRGMTVTATTAGCALVFYPHQFAQIFETAPEIERVLRRALARPARVDGLSI